MTEVQTIGLGRQKQILLVLISEQKYRESLKVEFVYFFVLLSPKVAPNQQCTLILVLCTCPINLGKE